MNVQKPQEGTPRPPYGAEGAETAAAPCGDARALLDAHTSERDWQAVVIEAAVASGWVVHHQLVPYRRGRDGKPRAIVEPGTEPGFPDLVLIHVGRGEVLFVELKRQDGQLSPAQRRWRDAIVRAGGRFFVWKPSDWPECERVLKGETV